MLETKWPVGENDHPVKNTHLPRQNDPDYERIQHQKQMYDDSDDLLDIAPELFGSIAPPPSYDDIRDGVFDIDVKGEVKYGDIGAQESPLQRKPIITNNTTSSILQGNKTGTETDPDEENTATTSL